MYNETQMAIMLIMGLGVGAILAWCICSPNLSAAAISRLVNTSSEFRELSVELEIAIEERAIARDEITSLRQENECLITQGHETKYKLEHVRKVLYDLVYSFRV